MYIHDYFCVYINMYLEIAHIIVISIYNYVVYHTYVCTYHDAASFPDVER